MTKPQYGHEHQLRRRRLVPAALGRPCPGCGRVMLKGMALDAAHSTDVAEDPHAKADHVRCASCNRSEGAIAGNQRQKFRPSRSW